MVIIVVLGWRGRGWRFGCTCKFKNGLFGVVDNSADLGHEGCNTVKCSLFEGINRLLDALFGGEELGFHELDGGIDVVEGNGVNLAEFFVTSCSSREFIHEVGYLNLQSSNSWWFGDGFLVWTIESVVVFNVSSGVIKLCMDGFEMGV